MAIYRFKITNPSLNEKMVEFAQYHKHEDRGTLKDSFKEWFESVEISELVEREKSILSQYNYDFKKGSIETKIFKSIKYYHIKKALGYIEQPISILSTSSRFTFSKSFMQIIKDYLIQNHDKAPSVSFESFLKEHACEITNEKEVYLPEIEQYLFDGKLKKMYKNQYYTNVKSCML
tara:strand:+ start:357 stop:884 length:528 start_codon:yes stop_codon:yes gene_type:complete